MATIILSDQEGSNMCAGEQFSSFTDQNELLYWAICVCSDEVEEVWGPLHACTPWQDDVKCPPIQTPTPPAGDIFHHDTTFEMFAIY